MACKPALLLLLAGAMSSVIPGCRANEQTIRVVRVSSVAPNVRESAQKLIDAYQEPEFDPPQLLWPMAFEVRHGNDVSTLIPLIFSQGIDDHEFRTQCGLIEAKRLNGKLSTEIIERKQSGFSDDYEPCASISAPLLVDVNGDGIQDAIFFITRINGVRETYPLSEVYLISPTSKLCHSPEASTLFIPEATGLLSKDDAEKISRSESKRLTALNCPDA